MPVSIRIDARRPSPRQFVFLLTSPGIPVCAPGFPACPGAPLLLSASPPDRAPEVVY